jgi:hypothetical protein
MPGDDRRNRPGLRRRGGAGGGGQLAKDSSVVGRFEPAGASTPGGRLAAIALRDLDRDGRAEVLVTDPSGERLLVLAESR